MCGEGLSKLLSASKFKSLESFDTQERKTETPAVRINSFPAFDTVVHTVVTLPYNICSVITYGSTLVDKDSKGFFLDTGLVTKTQCKAFLDFRRLLSSWHDNPQ